MKLLIPHSQAGDKYLVEAALYAGHEVVVLCNALGEDARTRVRDALYVKGATIDFTSVPSQFELGFSRRQYADFYHTMIRDHVLDLGCDAILPSSGADSVIEAISEVNQEFDLPGIRADDAPLLNDKSIYLPMLEASGVRVPRVLDIVEPGHEPSHYDFPYPVLAKPGLGSGGYGVYVADDHWKLHWFFDVSDNPDGFSERAAFYQDKRDGKLRNYLHYGMEGRYVVQEYMEGPIISLAGTSAGGELTVDLAYDIGVTPPPACAEVNFGWPSIHRIDAAVESFRADLQKAVKFADGAWMADCILSADGELYLIDLASRMSSSGTKMLVHACDNLSYPANVISSVLYGDRDFKVKPKYGVYYSFLPFPKGQILDVTYPRIPAYGSTELIESVLPVRHKSRTFEMRNDRQVADRGWIVMRAHRASREGAQEAVEAFIDGISYEVA